MTRINWIHLSDMHLGDSRAADTIAMRKTLPSYIAGLGLPFDYAFFTGDIKEWSADYSSVPKYVKTICDSARTPLERLFIVPGNHDVEIKEDDTNGRTALIEKIKDGKSDYYASSDGVISDKDMTLLKSGEKDFITFIEKLLGKQRADLYAKPHFVVQTPHFNILHVDSTLTYGRNSERDFIVGTRTLTDALEACDSSKPTILLTHYSFEFLSQSEKNQVEMLLSTYNVQLWLAGHEHENLIRLQRDKFYECQCGNLALQKEARSCFLTSELDLDTGKGVMTVHAWYESKGWSLYPFARVGSEDNSIYPFTLRLPGQACVSVTSPLLQNAWEAYKALSAPSGIFFGVSINPAILSDLEWEGNEYTNCGSPYPIELIMEKLWSGESFRNALILGDGGMGKSTMMYHACGRILADKRIALYISLQMLEGSEESILDFICRSLYASLDDGARKKFIGLVSARHTQPDIILFIDGFNELSGRGAQRYVAGIKSLSQYAGIQIIISSRLNFLRDFGLSYFGMIHPCGLRGEQVQSLFSARPDDFKNIEEQKTLRTLVQNPMMALLYAQTCPVVEKHASLDYLDWIVPITNASDLLHDYYLAQIASLLERQSVDAQKVLDGMIAIDRVLPRLGYIAERRNTTIWKETDFACALQDATDTIKRQGFCESPPQKIQKVQRRFRIHKVSVDSVALYDLIITELCLLKSGDGKVSFSHQIFRDYFSAVHLHHALMEKTDEQQLWHDEKINKGVVQYLKNIGGNPLWGADGQMQAFLKPYRNRPASPNDYFLENILDCWLSVGEGERDLSSLDLRNISLAQHITSQYNGTISIDRAWLSRKTLLNERHHDKIVGFAFSHDNRTLAAVSLNGIVSITNILTQSQMIVAQLDSCESVRLGFDANDYLIIKNGTGVFTWRTIAYDKMETGNEGDIFLISVGHNEAVSALQKRLEESDLAGILWLPSENGRYLAVGFESGFIQVWDTEQQECIANLSLSDSQMSVIAFSMDGKIAALGSGGKLVQIWDMEHGKCMDTLCFDRRVNKVRIPAASNSLECQFSDGKYCAVNLMTKEIAEVQKPNTKPFVSEALTRRLASPSMKVKEIKSVPKGNAIVLTNDGKAFTWDETQKRLSPCPGHNSPVTAVAVCAADERFAASYSPEKYHADKNDKKRRNLLDKQHIVRVRIVKTGQCQWRLPTKGRSIAKLQFFTSNRIILAGYATNGDILLWELINEQKFGREIGRWESVEIVKNSQAEPIECAFPADKQNFISAYADGTLLVRPFSGSGKKKKIATLPGINAGVFRWQSIQCAPELQQMLDGYRH